MMNFIIGLVGIVLTLIMVIYLGKSLKNEPTKEDNYKRNQPKKILIGQEQYKMIKLII